MKRLYQAFSVYALIETDDKTSQGIDEIYTGKRLDKLTDW